MFSHQSVAKEDLAAISRVSGITKSTVGKGSFVNNRRSAEVTCHLLHELLKNFNPLFRYISNGFTGACGRWKIPFTFYMPEM